ncbi:MAG TPA: MurR/RpiR family transcriptional regulator [Streptosporangiaceae bacterium]|nr:MurR/RpiR family transcriptional regulator [Streptosporangiaceae bacterium]
MTMPVPGDPVASDTAAGESGLTVAERLHLKLAELTPAERKVARALMVDYPVLGLEPVAKLAAVAGVSAPTVIRLVTKLSFDGYAEFQQSLKSEVSARLSSPREMHAGRLAGERGDVLSRAEQMYCEGIRASFARLPRSEFEQVIRLLADSRRGVTVIGGRFSFLLAEYLAANLRVLRPNVHVVSSLGADRVGSLLDVGRRDVVVVFDYRRYQRDTVRAAAIAKKRGATLIVFTDPYLSPLGAQADVLLTSSVLSPSPFITLTPALAMVEAIIAAVLDRLADAPLERMARYDTLSAGTVAEAREEA